MYRVIIAVGTIVLLLVAQVDSTHWSRKASRAQDLDIQRRDQHGCDAMLVSCGKNGGCCDQHDECYKKYGCTQRSWLYVGNSTIKIPFLSTMSMISAIFSLSIYLSTEQMLPMQYEGHGVHCDEKSGTEFLLRGEKLRTRSIEVTFIPSSALELNHR